MARRRGGGVGLRAQVALEPLRNEVAVPEPVDKYQLHPNQAYAWKKRLLDGLPGFRRTAQRTASNAGFSVGVSFVLVMKSCFNTRSMSLHDPLSASDERSGRARAKQALRSATVGDRVAAVSPIRSGQWKSAQRCNCWT